MEGDEHVEELVQRGGRFHIQLVQPVLAHLDGVGIAGYGVVAEVVLGAVHGGEHGGVAQVIHLAVGIGVLLAAGKHVALLAQRVGGGAVGILEHVVDAEHLAVFDHADAAGGAQALCAEYVGHFVRRDQRLQNGGILVGIDVIEVDLDVPVGEDRLKVLIHGHGSSLFRAQLGRVGGKNCYGAQLGALRKRGRENAEQHQQAQQHGKKSLHDNTSSGFILFYRSRPGACKIP